MEVMRQKPFCVYDTLGIIKCLGSIRTPVDGDPTETRIMSLTNTSRGHTLPVLKRL
jgi:hypothetical protein